MARALLQGRPCRGRRRRRKRIVLCDHYVDNAGDHGHNLRARQFSAGDVHEGPTLRAGSRTRVGGMMYAVYL